MEAGLREVCRSVRIGKILIQRVRANRLSILYKAGLNRPLGRRDSSPKTLLLQSWLLMPLRRHALTHIHCSSLRTLPTATFFSSTLCSVGRAVLWLYLDSLSSVRPATGGSAVKAVEVLMEHGVPEERIIFINLVSHTPEYFLLSLTLLDFCTGGPQKFLQQVSSITCGTSPAAHTKLLLTPRHWIDNRLD